MTPLRIFIGYDSREPIAYHVLAHSILRQASEPVTISPLVLPSLRWIYKRERGPLESTEFTLTRFLVPFLSGYQGVSLYMDCDMLVRGDVLGLFGTPYPRRAVWVVKHDYTPKTSVKFLDQPQTAYPRKNWSSLMVFDNALCRALTPLYVNTATPAELHRFAWLKDEEIGELSKEDNWLVGEYPANPKARILHYTLGGPWWPETKGCDHADEWLAEQAHMEGLGG